jgi:hypothetical protein
MPFSIGGGGAHDDTSHQGSAKKAIASGVASLDAGTLIPAAQVPNHGLSKHTADAKASSGNYVGNDTANRAIPHGLGRIPSMVFIAQSGGINYNLIYPTAAQILYLSNASNVLVYAVTVCDSTNLYVGNATSYGASGNATGTTYNWVVL